jgi:hypothetical protein
VRAPRSDGASHHTAFTTTRSPSRDKRHPSPAGTYLAACTTFAALTGRSPVGNAYHAGLDEPTAKFLQEVAWETVQDYYGK